MAEDKKDIKNVKEEKVNAAEAKNYVTLKEGRKIIKERNRKMQEAKINKIKASKAEK